jgi:hypothetical protein
MESIVRNVQEIEAAEKRVYEVVLGQQLRDNQQVIVRLLTPPAEETRQKALANLKKLSEKGNQHRQSLGVSEEVADEILREAKDHVRRTENE